MIKFYERYGVDSGHSICYKVSPHIREVMMTVVLSAVPTTALNIAGVTVAMLLVMALLGTNPFSSAKRFGVCFAVALVIAIVVTGGFTVLYGPAQITKL